MGQVTAADSIYDSLIYVFCGNFAVASETSSPKSLGRPRLFGPLLLLVDPPSRAVSLPRGGVGGRLRDSPSAGRGSKRDLVALRVLGIRVVGHTLKVSGYPDQGTLKKGGGLPFLAEGTQKTAEMTSLEINCGYS